MAVAFRDYYELLGVKKAASYKEVRSAFRKLARQHHPDVNPGNAEAERRFKEVNEANEVLSDPEKRKLYDELGSKWKDYVHFKENGGEATPAEFLRGTRAQPVGGHGKTGYRTTSDNDLNDMFGDQSPFSDFFQQAFSGGRRSSPQKGQNIEQIAQITLREAINGTSRTLTYSDPGGPRRIEAKIPPGVRQGSRIRLAGQGAQGQSGGPPGDLFLIVDIAPDTQFELRDNDVLTTLKVPLFTMLLGGEVTAPTPKGGKAALRIPEGTQNGRVFRLSGLGLPPTKANGKAGALLVRVDAILPSALTPEQKGLVEKLSTMHGQIRDASV